MIEQSDDARAYYADGFRRTFGGVPCKVFSRRTADGRYLRAKGSPFYDPEFDHPKTGRSRLNEAASIEAAAKVAAAEQRQAVESIEAFARAMADILDTEPFPVGSNVVAVNFAAAAAARSTETHEEPDAPAEPAEPACAPAAPAAPVAAISEPVPAMLADLLRRVAELEALVSPSSRECDPPSAETDAAPLPADPRARAVGKGRAPVSRHSPARERLLRRYLAMRAERAEMRRQFAFGMAQYEQVKVELAEARKPQHPNEPAPDLVAQLHRERDEAGRKLNEATNRADALERAVDRLADEVQSLSGRAHRAEAALRLERVRDLPRLAHVGTPAARVSFQLPAIGRVQ